MTADLTPQLSHEILWTPGADSAQKQPRSPAGPLAPGYRISGWGSGHGAAINSATSWPARDPCKGPVCRLQLSLQHYHTWNPHQTLSLLCLLFVSAAPASCVMGVSMCGPGTSRFEPGPRFTTGGCPLLLSFYMNLIPLRTQLSNY